MKSWSLEKVLLSLLESFNTADSSVIYERYDKNVKGNTVTERGKSVASVVAPFVDYKELEGSSERLTSVAIGVGGNPYYAMLDSKLAAEYAVCQALLDIKSLGAEALGLTDCLNFGNPEKSKSMGDFVSALEGLKFACESLSIPVVSGNVSLYNEHEDLSVPPSSIVSVFGRISNPESLPPMAFASEDKDLWYLGLDLFLDGSEASKTMKVSGVLPKIDYKKFKDFLGELQMVLPEIQSLVSLKSGGIWRQIVFCTQENQKGCLVDFDEENFPSNLLGEGLGVLVSSNSDFSHLSCARKIGKTMKEKVIDIRVEGKTVFKKNTSELYKIWKDNLRNFL